MKERHTSNFETSIKLCGLAKRTLMRDLGEICTGCVLFWHLPRSPNFRANIFPFLTHGFIYFTFLNTARVCKRGKNDGIAQGGTGG